VLNPVAQFVQEVNQPPQVILTESEVREEERHPIHHEETHIHHGHEHEKASGVHHTHEHVEKKEEIINVGEPTIPAYHEDRETHEVKPEGEPIFVESNAGNAPINQEEVFTETQTRTESVEKMGDVIHHAVDVVHNSPRNEEVKVEEFPIVHENQVIIEETYKTELIEEPITEVVETREVIFESPNQVVIEDKIDVFGEDGKLVEEITVTEIVNEDTGKTEEITVTETVDQDTGKTTEEITITEIVNQDSEKTEESKTEEGVNENDEENTEDTSKEGERRLSGTAPDENNEEDAPQEKQGGKRNKKKKGTRTK